MTDTGSDWDFAAEFATVLLWPAVAFCLAWLVRHEVRERRARRAMRRRLDVNLDIDVETVRRRLDADVARIVVPVSPEVFAEIREATRAAQAERTLTKAFGPQPSNRTGDSE